jgi:ABC-2 type transport system permease protein
MIAALKNVIHYFPLLGELVGRDLKKKYRRSILGYVWSLLNPLLMMVVVSAVFSYIFRNNIENYRIYLIIGQTVYGYFSSATSHAMESLTNNNTLLNKIYIPKVIFPFASVMFEFVNFIYSLIAIFIVIVFSGVPFTPTIILFPIGLLYLTMFCIGVGLILSVAVVFFRDIVHLYRIVLMAWMYLTPIFYSVDQLSPWMKNIVILNPLFHYINYFRMIILWNTIPSFKTNISCFGFGAVLMIIGLLFFKQKQDNIIYHI